MKYVKDISPPVYEKIISQIAPVWWIIAAATDYDPRGIFDCFDTSRECAEHIFYSLDRTPIIELCTAFRCARLEYLAEELESVAVPVADDNRYCPADTFDQVSTRELFMISQLLIDWRTVASLMDISFSSVTDNVRSGTQEWMNFIFMCYLKDHGYAVCSLDKALFYLGLDDVSEKVKNLALRKLKISEYTVAPVASMAPVALMAPVAPTPGSFLNPTRDIKFGARDQGMLANDIAKSWKDLCITLSTPRFATKNSFLSRMTIDNIFNTHTAEEVSTEKRCAQIYLQQLQNSHCTMQILREGLEAIGRHDIITKHPEMW